MLRVYAGENCLLSDELVRRIGDALAGEDAVQYIVVPKQLTLLTERLLLDGLKLPGSFRLRVLSPARLCSRIFEAAGQPDGVRVDERGRVMLVRQAIRSADGLTIYKNADRRRGFADRCARQLELFLQGSVTAEKLRECAGDSTGMTRMKLMDLAAILEAYVALMVGRYRDGETELSEAALRVPKARFVSEGHFWFFGFDMTPPTLNRLIAAVAAQAPNVELLFPLGAREGDRDYDCVRPLEKALERMVAACRAAGTQLMRVDLNAPTGNSETRFLARELYAYPAQCREGEVRCACLAYARYVREECMLAAATARECAMRGTRYGEIQLLCADMENYRQGLIEAFEMYEVPLFLESSRPASRMATAECLLTALRMIDKNFRSEDVFTLMRCGYMDISGDEADRLANYAVRRGIDGSRWLRPLNRGSEAEIEALEPIRARLMKPVVKLKEDLKSAGNLKEQLAAIFGFLTEINAHGRSLELQRKLNENGMREMAGALGQSWNRIIGALDQMAALMGEERLALRELTQTLSESLEAAVIKPLPQSGDAVYAQSVDRMLMQKAETILIVGLADGASGNEEGLLTAAQKKTVSEKARAWLGPDETDTARMRRFYMKAALGMAKKDVYFSCALSGNDGSARRPGMTVELLREIFPGMKIMSETDKAMLLSCAPRAAFGGAARAASARREGEEAQKEDLTAENALRAAAKTLPEMRDRLRRLDGLLQGDEGRTALAPSSARELYGKLQTQSITRLERYAGCPFSYYMQYGLRPEKIEPFEFDRRQAGTFLHEAVHEFLRVCGRELNCMDANQAEVRMARIADEMLERMRFGSPMEDSAAARAESRALRATACRCARVLAEHMQGSAFQTDQLERSFGREDGSMQLRAGNTVLEGRIDRVDTWPEGNSLRVIDFKLGGKPLNLAGTYHGLQLQLPVYLGAALKQKKARSAGVYYFALDEGVVNTQSTDPNQVEKERAGKFRMNGLLPADPELIRAQTPNPSAVFRARMTGGGKLYADVPCADDQNFNRLIMHTLRMAQRHLDAIRSGDVRVSPSNFDGRDACGICDYRSACLFDGKLDAAKVRRLKNIKWNEVFDRIALEQDQKEGN